MLIMRTYALYERNKKVLTGMVLFTLGALIHGGVRILWDPHHLISL